MEDAHETVAHFDGDPSTSFFAVYDGHGGMYVYTYSRRRWSEDVRARAMLKKANFRCSGTRPERPILRHCCMEYRVEPTESGL